MYGVAGHELAACDKLEEAAAMYNQATLRYYSGMSLSNWHGAATSQTKLKCFTEQTSSGACCLNPFVGSAPGVGGRGCRA
eukprot:487226-Amphidinium_carterae.2